MKSLPTEEIQDILSQEPKLLQKGFNAQLEGGIHNHNALEEQKVQDFYLKQIQNIEQQHIIPLETLVKISLEIERKCESYKHNLYQCAVTSSIASQTKTCKIVKMPTGSGKTWIQGLLANLYTNQGKKVSIIVPNNNLKQQTQELLNDISYDLSVITIDQFYEYPSDDQVIIVNEYDSIIENKSFKAVTNGLTGVWQLQNREVIFLQQQVIQALREQFDIFLKISKYKNLQVNMNWFIMYNPKYKVKLNVVRIKVNKQLYYKMILKSFMKKNQLLFLQKITQFKQQQMY